MVVAREGTVTKELMAVQPSYPSNFPVPLPEWPQFSPAEAENFEANLRMHFTAKPEESDEEEIISTEEFDRRGRCGHPESEEEYVMEETGEELKEILLDMIGRLMEIGLSEEEAIKETDAAMQEQLKIMGIPWKTISGKK